MFCRSLFSGGFLRGLGFLLIRDQGVDLLINGGAFFGGRFSGSFLGGKFKRGRFFNRRFGRGFLGGKFERGRFFVKRADRVFGKRDQGRVGPFKRHGFLRGAFVFLFNSGSGGFRTTELFFVLFVERFDFFVGDRVEKRVVDVGANNFQREKLRLGKAGFFRIGAVDDVFILFVERARLNVARIGDFADVIARLEDGDFRFGHAMKRFVRFERFRRRNLNGAVTVSHLSQTGLRVQRRETIAAVVFANLALVGDLAFHKFAKRGVVEPGGTRRARENVAAKLIVGRGSGRGVVTNDLRELLKILDYGFFVGNELFAFRKFQDEPTGNERFGVGRRVADLHTKRGQLRGRNRLHFLRGGIQIIQERLKTQHILTRHEEFVIVERSEFLGLGDVADKARTGSLIMRSHALKHRAQRDKREHRKEGQPRHPGLLVAAEHAKGVMFFGHWNRLSYADLVFARSSRRRRRNSASSERFYVLSPASAIDRKSVARRPVVFVKSS